MLTDDEIIGCYLARDENAIAVTSQKYGHLCYGVSYNILRVREEAEECVNDTYLRVWDSVPPDKPLNLKCYLLKIARNISLDRLKYLKRKKRSSELDISLSELENILPDQSIPEEFDSSCLAEALDTFLDTLEKDARIILVARYWYFYPISEISNKFGFTESKVKTSLSRSREKLKKYLNERGIFQ